MLGLESGPGSTEGQLAEDARARDEIVGAPWLDDALAPYFDWKKRVHDKIGLQFAGDYTALYSVATASPNEPQAAGGIYRAFGTWGLVDRGGDFAGSLIFKGENRHAIGTELAPIALGFAAGSALPTGVPFSDAGWLLSNLFWKQKIGSRVVLQFGQVDTTDYLDLYGLVNPWTHFTNVAFLTNPTIPAPSQGLGSAVSVWLSDELYLIAGFADPNADPADPFNDFFSEGEFFTHGEIGLTTSRDRFVVDNIHITGWHVDERGDAGVPDGWGLSFSGARFLGDRWMPFLRAGFSDDGGSLLEATVAGGFGMLFGEAGLLGVGLSWGRPHDDGAGDQYTSELFYRIQVLPSLAITPDMQLVIDPPLEPERNVVAVFGVRTRLAF